MNTHTHIDIRNEFIFYFVFILNSFINFITFLNSVFFHYSLQILSMGGNLLSEVPEAVGNLSHLQGLILCDNLIENLPTSIARLKNLKSLLLHKNRLKHLPRDIISLKNLVEVNYCDACFAKQLNTTFDLSISCRCVRIL